MNDATKEILSTYDKDELKEIADHGCESGVCSQHIYYGEPSSSMTHMKTRLLSISETHIALTS